MTRIYKEFSILSTGRVAVAAAASVSFQLNVPAEADFEAIKLTGFSDVAGAAVTYSTRPVPNVNILITNTGSGRQLMNVAVPFFALFGSGEKPFILPQPMVFSARSVIQIQFTSFEAVNANNIQLDFNGNKVFTY